MSQTNSPLTHISRTIGIILSLFLLSLASGLATASNRAETPALTALVRIDLSTPADLRRVAALDVPVYAYLHSPGGQAYLLALANTPQQKALADQGLALRMLDPNSQGATYYVLTAFRPGAIDRARARVNILDEDGRQAVARATPDQAGQLPELGFELKRLGPDPIDLPLEEKAPAIPEAITPIPIIQGMIDQVYTATVYNYDAELSGAKAATIGGGSYTILNRNTYGGAPIQHATQYVYEHFLADGLTTSYQQWNTINNPNVIGEKPGHSQASRIFLVTAHLDDMPTGPVAPGADDNASGSVGVLVAADILSQYDFDCTLRYIVFTGEEQGLLGSYAYAESVVGQDIEAVLNLDMISYNTLNSRPGIDLIVRPGNASDHAIANLFADVVNAYDINLEPQVVEDSAHDSDHASFWDYGFSAILGIEDFSDFNPNYHTTNDKIGTLDMNYFTWFVKAAVGTLAHMGCLPPPSGHLAGMVSDAQSSAPVQGATVKAMLSPDQAWATTSESDGSYDIALYPGVYTVTAQAPSYMLYSTAGISVTADQTTTLNIALEVTPTLTLSGYVRDAVSGVPLSGTVSILDSSIPPAHTNPTTGFYSLDLFLGTYTLRASAENYHPQNQVVHLTANQQQDFNLQRTCLLVVDDDGGMAYDTYYTSALDRLGYDYRRVTQSPDLGLLSLYQGVIWLTGDQSIGTLTAADRSSLAAYLDGGGRLFLSGQDIGKDIGSSDFYRDYLHAAYLADNTGLYRLSGLNFLGGLTTIFILGPGGANNQTSPDEVVPANSGVPVYYYLDTSRYGAVAYSGTHRTVYFGFGYEAINQQSSRDAVMDAVLEYIGVCGTPQAPQAGFLSSLPDASGMVRFTNTSTGTPLMTYTWDFGDDTVFSTEANPEHTYLQVGQYTVVLTATSPYGQDTFSDTVEILPTYPVYLPILRKDTP